MPKRLRAVLAALRVTFAVILLCAATLGLDLTLRHWRDLRAGMSGPLPPQHDTPFLGIHTELQADTSAQVQAQAAALAGIGLEWARLRLDWSELEPAPGDFHWQLVDDHIAALNDVGLVLVLLLDGSPNWARAASDHATPHGERAPPADPADFARFAHAVATRYGERVRYYQVWDEPNIAPHWGARHIEPVAYAQLLKPAAAAIRAADADAVILAAALAPTLDRGHTALDEVTFLQRLYAAGAADSFDAVALQPFGFGASPADTDFPAQRLTFQRARWVRQAMLDAGDGATPVWLIRSGWNTRLDSPWQTVTPTDQVDFTLTTLEIAYHQWPWIAAVGWAVDAPAAPSSDPAWGFALSDDLADALRQWQYNRPPRLHPAPTPPSAPVALWAWLVLIPLFGWRGWSAWRVARAAPLWTEITGQAQRRPRTALALVWAVLLTVYYLATWPPLIIACWLLAAWAMSLRPRAGLYLALLLLPFHAYHKEFDWGGFHIAVAPSHAVLLCLLPTALRTPIVARRRPRLDRWSVLALAWVVIGLLALGTVWHWPAYAQGMLDLVLAPVALFFIVRHITARAGHTYAVAAVLAAGGILAALMGLLGWLGGSGTLADGMRRLVGPTFSPNHTALYLERTLFATLGLAWSVRGTPRRAWFAATAIVAVALALTGSRGALLLALPAGLAVFFWQSQWLQHPQRRAVLGIGIAILAIATVLILGDRLVNLATVGSRWEGWQATWQLVRAYPLTGVGPGGFFWHYPAYLPPVFPTEPNLRHPHQLWLELASSGGIVALGWFAVAAGLLVRHVRAHPLDALRRGLLAGLVAALAHAQVDAFQALPDLAAWNWVALALLVGGQSKTAAPKDSGSDSA